MSSKTHANQNDVVARLCLNFSVGLVEVIDDKLHFQEILYIITYSCPRPIKPC